MATTHNGGELGHYAKNRNIFKLKSLQKYIRNVHRAYPKFPPFMFVRLVSEILWFFSVSDIKILDFYAQAR